MVGVVVAVAGEALIAVAAAVDANRQPSIH